MFVDKGSAGNQRKPCNKAHGERGMNLEILKGSKTRKPKVKLKVKYKPWANI